MTHLLNTDQKLAALQEEFAGTTITIPSRFILRVSHKDHYSTVWCFNAPTRAAVIDQAYAELILKQDKELKETPN